MASNHTLYSGLIWAFTPFAKDLLLELCAAGITFDLAVALLDNQVRNGLYREEEIYALPEE